jgi:hypothetical protein
MKTAALGLAVCIAAGMSSACWAQDLKATQKFTDTEIGFEPAGSYGNYTLTVTGPNGLHAIVSSRSGAPSIDLRKLGTLDDGGYNYQLTASTEEKVPLRSQLDNGRDGGPDTSMLKSVSLSGRFDVKGGTIVKNDPAAPEPTNKRQK